MTAQETLDVIELLGANWPQWIGRMTERQLELVTETWATLMGDLDAAVVRAAVAQYLAEPREWPPTAGQVNTLARELLAKARGDDEWDAGRAWREVCRAIEPYGYGAAWIADRKALLPDYVVRIAEDYGIQRILMRMEANAGTDFAQFRDVFEARHKRERQMALMPTAVRNMLTDVAAALDAKRLKPPEAQ